MLEFILQILSLVVTLAHFIIYRPPFWIIWVASFSAVGYYIYSYYQRLRYPLQMLLFALQSFLVFSIVYGLLLGIWLLVSN